MYLYFLMFFFYNFAFNILLFIPCRAIAARCLQAPGVGYTAYAAGNVSLSPASHTYAISSAIALALHRRFAANQ